MSNSSTEDTNDKPACMYGTQCYRKNKQHIEKYEHAPTETENEELPVAKKPCTGRSSLKQQKLNLFFSKNTVKNSPNKSNNAIAEKSNPEKRLEEIESVPEDKVGEGSSHENITEFTFVIKENYQRIIEELFFVHMPDDFFSLWEFCRISSPKNPFDALKIIDLVLVGPYDVLNGRMKNNIDSTVACRHWRYFYDPPEFQTILKSNGSDLLHFGYYRDDPKDLPVFVGYNKAAKDAVITCVGENVFAAISWCVNQVQDKINPFQRTQLSILQKDLQKWAKNHEFSLDAYTENIRKRDKNVVAKTFHHAGIVVPYDKKTEVGYRPVSKTPTQLTKILKQIAASKTESERTGYMAELHEVITWANIAVDESDFGTALELGIDLFCFGNDIFKSMVLQLLTSSYKLLKRDAYATIIKAHLENRKKGNDLSVLGRKLQM